MFAYCLNNPQNGKDPCGSLTDGQIHDEVLQEIVRRSANKYKHKRTDTLIIYDTAWKFKWFGFCDLYDPVTGETWELKKNSPSWTCRTEYAEIQLSNYINNGTLASNEVKLRYPDTTIPSGRFSITDISGTKYIINYWDQGGGILRYQYMVIPSEYDVAFALALASCFCAYVLTRPGGKINTTEICIDH